MTAESPWTGRTPQPVTEHTMTTEDYASIVEEVSSVLRGRTCCSQHAARIAVTAAVACLLSQYGDRLDTIDRELRNLCNLVMNNFRNGLFRPDAKRTDV